MSPEERRRRMHRMRRQLHNSTIFDWLDSILGRATEIMGSRSTQPRCRRRDTGDRAGASDLTPALAQRLAGAPLVLLLDIDGTLAPIAPRPEIRRRAARDATRARRARRAALACTSARLRPRARAMPRRLVGVDERVGASAIMASRSLRPSAPPARATTTSRSIDEPIAAARRARVESIADATARRARREQALDAERALSTRRSRASFRSCSAHVARRRERTRTCASPSERKCSSCARRWPSTKARPRSRSPNMLGALEPGASLFCAGDDGRTKTCSAHCALRSRAPSPFASATTAAVDDDGASSTFADTGRRARTARRDRRTAPRARQSQRFPLFFAALAGLLSLI